MQQQKSRKNTEFYNINDETDTPQVIAGPSTQQKTGYMAKNKYWAGNHNGRVNKRP